MKPAVTKATYKFSVSLAISHALSIAALIAVVSPSLSLARTNLTCGTDPVVRFKPTIPVLSKYMKLCKQSKEKVCEVFIGVDDLNSTMVKLEEIKDNSDYKLDEKSVISLNSTIEVIEKLIEQKANSICPQ